MLKWIISESDPWWITMWLTAHKIYSNTIFTVSPIYIRSIIIVTTKVNKEVVWVMP